MLINNCHKGVRKSTDKDLEFSDGKRTTERMGVVRIGIRDIGIGLDIP